MKTTWKKCTLLNFFIVFLAIGCFAQIQMISAEKGPFKPTDESLKQYQYPEWFRDAKFGIWSCWGPQAVPHQGDWYVKRMYQEKDSAYKYHLEQYCHPSVVGYKDI